MATKRATVSYADGHVPPVLDLIASSVLSSGFSYGVPYDSDPGNRYRYGQGYIFYVGISVGSASESRSNISADLQVSVYF